MTAEQLRNSILQEAISGRLVPQDPNDESASALLARIREEKARLVKEGKLKKKDLVETPITDEEKPFEIPSSWEWVRYQDIADCALGKTKNPNQVEGELCQYLCSINVYWDSVRLNVLKEMLFSDTDKQKYSIEKGDMLICEGGEAGRSAIYEGNISPIYYQNALHRVRFYGGICTRFFLYQMELYKKTGLLTDHIKGETIQHFVSTKLLNLPIPLPPLAEQKRIVAKLEELLPIVEQYGKAQTELDELNAALPSRLRQSILQEAISGRLVPQDPNDEPAEKLLNRLELEKKDLVAHKILKKQELDNYELEDQPEDIPTGWQFVKLHKICTLLDGEKKSGKYICMDAKFLRGKSQGVYLGSGKFVQKGDNVILIDGENSGEIFIAPIDGYMGSTFKQLWISKEMYAPYVEYLIKSFKETLRNDKKGAAIPHLKKELFFNLPVGIPPLAEQKRIVAKIEELFAEIDKLSK